MNFSTVASNGGLFCDGDWIEKKDQNPDGTVRLIQLADIGVCEFRNKSSRYITEKKIEELHCTLLEKGDILIARLPDPLGRACIFPLEGSYITAVDIAILRIRKKDINSKYVMYLINSPAFRNEIKKYESGTTRKRISRKNLEKINFELPSLIDQNRIVARIEELFSELDKAVETLQKTKQQLEVYRQAVLKEAFESSGVHKHFAIEDLCDNIVDCPHSTPKWTIDGKICLRTTNFKKGFLDLSQKNYVSEETYLNRIGRLKPMPGDVLFSREGAILGIACMIPDGLEICMGQRMMLLRPSEKLNGKYLMHYLNSPMARQLVVDNVGGSASPHINVGDIKRFTIPLVSIDVQNSIVNDIEASMSVCNDIERTVDAALLQSAALRQSILKQAFEGETF